MINGIYAAVSGLMAAQKRVEQSASNVANASTTGYVPRRVEQADVAGGGTRISATTPLSPGPIVQTGQSLDLAIDGPGLFALSDPEYGQVYSRAGNFTLNEQGQLVDPSGRALSPAVSIPIDAVSVRVTPEGQVQALAGDGSIISQGQIQTAVFGNTGGLEPIGGNAYTATAASGPPVSDIPGAAGHGNIVSGALQASGTDLASEIVNQIIGQRAFEANIATIQTYDEMLGNVVNIRA